MLEGSNSPEMSGHPPAAHNFEFPAVTDPAEEITVPGPSDTPPIRRAAEATYAGIGVTVQTEIAPPSDTPGQHKGGAPTEAVDATQETIQPRRRAAPGIVRVRYTEKPIITPGETVAPDRKHTPGTHTVPNAVIGATRRGRTHEFRIIKGTPNGETHIYTTPALLPPGSVHERVEPTEGDDAQELLTPSNLQSWGILVRAPLPVVDDISTQDTRDPERADRRDMDITTHHREIRDPNAIIIVGEPIPDDALKPLIDTAYVDFRKAESKPSMQSMRPEYETRLREVSSMVGRNGVREYAIVGAETDDQLDAIAEAAAGRLLSATNHKGWIPILDQNGSVAAFGSPEAAKAVARGLPLTPDAVVHAREFADEFVYPSDSIPGVGKTYDTRFSAHGPKLAPGADTVKLARVYHKGIPTTEMLKIDKKVFGRHGIIIGMTGSGKTEFEMQVATASTIAAHERARETGGPVDHTVTIFDGEKRGDFNELANRLAAIPGATKEQSTVTIVDPLSNGVLPTFDAMRLVGNTFEEQRAIGVAAYSAGVTEGDAREVFTKYTGIAIDLAGARNGWGKEWAYDTPATATRAQMLDALKEATEVSGFSAEIKGNVGSFNENKFKQKMQESAGMLLHPHGYPVDIHKVNHNEGATVFQLGGIMDRTAKGAIMTLGIRGIRSGLRSENNNAPAPYARQLLLVDEPGEILGDNDVGLDNADAWITMRNEGCEGWIAVQGNLKDRVHTNIQSNSANTFAFLTPLQEDRQTIAERTGRTTVDQLAILASTPPGRGVYMGPGLEEAVEVQTLNPYTGEVPRGQGIVAGPEAVLDVGHDRRFYTRHEKQAADEFLNTDLGNKLIEWAEINAPCILNNYPIIPINGSLKDELNQMLSDDTPPTPEGVSPRTKLQCALDWVTGDAADSRPQIMNFMKRNHLAVVLREAMEANIPPDAPPPELPPTHVVYPHAKLRLVQEKVVTALQPPALGPESFTGYCVVPGGDHAWHQRSNIINIEKGHATGLHNTIVALAQGPAGKNPDILKQALTEAWGTAAAAEDPAANNSEAAAAMLSGIDLGKLRETLQRFAVDAPEDQTTAEYIHGRIRSKVLQPLSPQGQKILEAMTADLEPNPTYIGYTEMLDHVNHYIEEYQKNQEALPLTEESEKYGYDFTAPNALAQLEVIKICIKVEVAKAGNYPVEMTDDFFAHDRRTGTGFTIDNTVAHAQLSALPKGAVNATQRAVINMGKPPDISLIATLSAASDPEQAGNVWIEHVKERFIHPEHVRNNKIRQLIAAGLHPQQAIEAIPEPDYLPPSATQDFLAGGYGTPLFHLKANAKAVNAAKNKTSGRS